MNAITGKLYEVYQALNKSYPFLALRNNYITWNMRDSTMDEIIEIYLKIIV